MADFRPKRVLVTGGAGFIGSSLVRAIVADRSIEKVVVLDALTYAGHRVNLDGVETTFVHGDICDRPLVDRLFAEHAFDAVLHLAAESHVDRSIESADAFIHTNVTGTFTLLDVARRAWKDRLDATRFVHCSTDEVFGALGPNDPAFTETTAYAPNSPYAASKASSDHLVRAHHKTYGLATIVTNTCNNYGPRQLPEKLIPLMIANAIEGKKLPVYGKGAQIREWIHVDDHVAGLQAALARGTPGESYLFGSGEELSNLEMVHLIADHVDAYTKRPKGTGRELITFVEDRHGHDFRYAIDASKARRALGWTPQRKLATALDETIRWYVENEAWRKQVSGDEHQRFQAAYYDKRGAAK
jgi:dTDP-glucose 4,6-dehydratase